MEVIHFYICRLISKYNAAIIYDNTPTTLFARQANNLNSPSIRYEDDKIAIHTGKAHLSFVPFGQEPIWGWGNAWRDQREFVGKIQYGTVYKLWHPNRHSFFGKKYHAGTEALLMLQRRNSLFARLPDECIYYILNMCRWDWFDDTNRDMKTLHRRRKTILREQRRQQMAQDVMDIVSQHASISATTGKKESCDKSADLNNETVAMDIEDDSKDHARGEEQDDIELDVDEEDADDDDEEDDDDEDDDNDDEDSNASSAWERAHGYRADTSRFVFQNVSSDDEDNNDNGGRGGTDDDDTAMDRQNHPWFGRRGVRQVVVRALRGTTRTGFTR